MKWCSRFLTPSLNFCSFRVPDKSCCTKLKWWVLFLNFFRTRILILKGLSMLSLTMFNSMMTCGSKRLRWEGFKFTIRCTLRLWMNMTSSTLLIQQRRRKCTTTSRCRSKDSTQNSSNNLLVLTHSRELNRFTSWELLLQQTDNWMKISTAKMIWHSLTTMTLRTVFGKTMN
jgi:hypothetical protein